MRLTNIKLAGFKSFVDPTNIQVPGQLVGVVGPNGCGKSNIIDAMRWVLGESRASALRGESMQDVIFNGTTARKPVARASVELVFDNSLGRAAGQWSQYAEISVKRILTREGDSSYYINNTQVRRRDIADIFLGTGVGPRAYAIIEQGMISRVIEAKPEDLRVFLEEAAGVSKYKERRRETENRLEDTRENLARVDDIRRELEAQIEKLERQAEVAQKYNELHGELVQKQALLAALRRRDAEAEADRHTRDIDRSTNDLEAETARLREVEKRLEQTRAEHYEAGDAVSAAQGALYEVNAEVSRLEAEIKFIAETRQRFTSQATQLIVNLAQWGRQSSELGAALDMWQARKVQHTGRSEAARAAAAQEQTRLPEAEGTVRQARAESVQVRESIAAIEREVDLEEAHRANAERLIGQLGARTERLGAERDALGAPAPERIAALAAQLGGFDAQLERFADDQRSMAGRLDALAAAQAAANERVQASQQARSQLGGRLAMLKTIQARVDENEPVDEWLERHGFAQFGRLWQSLRVEPGWEPAIEAVLRERLHAVVLAGGDAFEHFESDAPAAKLTLASVGEAIAPAAIPAGRPLAAVVHCNEPRVQVLLDDWLTGYVAVEAAPSAAERAALPAGTTCVTRAGHQYRRYSVSFHSPDDGDAGILARAQEIEGLEREAAELGAALAQTEAAFAAADSAVAGARGVLEQLRRSEQDTKQARHAVELEHQRLTQEAARSRSRAQAIAAELAEIAGAHDGERRRVDEAVAALAGLAARLADARSRAEAGLAAQQSAEQALERQRAAALAAEREAQEAAFALRECDSKIAEVERSLGSMATQIEASTQQERGLREELGRLQDAGLREKLDVLLGARVERESALASARDRHEDLNNQLRATEEERLAIEQKLGPLRERISELRLKEQAARLAVEQFRQQLAEAGVDEETLLAGIEKAPRPNALQSDITRLSQSIAALGAINMAALEELASSSERKDYLDRQSADLTEALTTLENAIRRIDRETRDLLKQTFDTVNKNFGELFPALFGGGEARLEMTGEEVLDAGVQVMAQPPGKRNQSIHLLSGGEKALTAISLVFAMFQLNPAPFCLLDEVDAPLDDTNTERFCKLVKKMSSNTQFVFISHNKITMELAQQLIGVTMQEKGVSRIVEVDVEEAMRMREAA